MTPTHLIALLDDRARASGADRGYRFVDTGERWSFGDVAIRAGRVAGQLDAVDGGARVGILTDDRAAFTDAFFGAHHRGLLPVPLGVGGRPGTDAWRTLLRDRVARFGLAAVLTDPGAAPTLGEAAAPVAVVGVDGARGDPVPASAPASHAFVQPSSGTTGDPKGVVIGWPALFADLAMIGEHWALGPDEVGLSWLPLFHDMGLVGTLINATYQGGTLYHWPTASFLRSPGRFLQLVAELGVTTTVAPPFALSLMARRQQRRATAVDLSGLRSLLVGAEQIRPAVLEEFLATFAGSGLRPGVVSPTYGLAEATLAVTATPRGRGHRVAEIGRHAVVSCGVPLPGVEVRLGADDELLVRSPALMDGYLDDPEATRSALADGWLRTGDTAAIVDGEIYVLGRAKEMINRAGLRVPATEFELALAGVDGLLGDRIVAFADVDADAGERVVVLAESRRRDGVGELVLAARARLADAGLPVDVLELVPAGFVPRTTSGKLRRAAARDKWRAFHSP